MGFFSASRCKTIAVAGLVVPGSLTKGLDLLWCHPNHSPLHLLLLQPLTFLLLLPLHQRLTGRMAPGCLYGGSHSVHCTVLCVHCTAPPPPLVPLLGHGGDLQLAAFIHRYTTRARPGTTHKRLLQPEGGALRLIILCCLPNYRLNKTQ